MDSNPTADKSIRTTPPCHETAYEVHVVAAAKTLSARLQKPSVERNAK
jgi:hypothetical protein